jgi:alpha-1,2-mannosyltransferase
VQAQAEMEPSDVSGRDEPRLPPWHRFLGSTGLILAVLLFVLSLTAYLTDQAVHRHAVLTWYDLNVYNDAGLITRQLPSILYTWELKVGVQFTYTPFAALLFAGGSLLPLVALRWLMTISSLAAIPLTVWLTLGGMGRRGPGRLAAALAVTALALWIQPVVKALFLGQIEPLLMLLVVWDLTRSDSRKWNGIGIGIAAGIKLVPLLFIPYLLLAGKIRQAAVATGAFVATVVVGFISLPGPSASYWLTGYFVRPGRTGSVHSLVNQSLLGSLARLYGTVAPAQPVWLPIALVVAAGGIVAGAMLARTGRPVHGWALVGVTSVLVSPVSWDHHWVWVVPVLALMAGLAFTARPVVKACYVLGIVVTAGIMGSWPWKYSGSRAFVPRRGLLGWFVKPPEVTQVKVVHGWQLLTWNLWVATGIVMYLGLIAAAVVAWRKRPRRQLSIVTPEKSPIDALLARADAVLRGGTLVGSGVSGQDDKSSGSGASWMAGSNGEISGPRYPAASSNGQVGGDTKAHDADTGASRPTAMPRPAR